MNIRMQARKPGLEAEGPLLNKGGAKNEQSPGEHIRKLFPESWIWADVTLRYDREKCPDVNSSKKSFLPFNVHDGCSAEKFLSEVDGLT